MSVDPRVETLKHLASIDATLKAILLVLSESRNDAPKANDRVCDGPHGDPIIKAKDPRDWTGEPMTGRRFSECPPEYLDLLAERYDYFAGREEDEKKARYNRLDAERARGWAARIRGGYRATVPDAGGFASDEPGF